MVFTAQQLQEKCQYQNADLYMAVVDLTKAFDSQPGGPMEHHGQVWMSIIIVHKLQDGMMASVRDQQELSDQVPITNGVKQGCILAPVLFTMVFSVMLQDSFQNNTGISFIYHCDGGYSIRGCKQKPKWRKSLFKNFCLQMTVLWLLAQMKNYRSVWAAFPQLVKT